MIHRDPIRSTFGAAAALPVFACLALAGCGSSSGYSQPPAPPAQDPLAAYPIARVQNAAPTAADFIEDVELGTLLTATVSGQQLTLYTFANDTAGTSNCQINADSTGCAKLWPPLFAGSTATAQGDFTLVTRNDGLKQWAWRGHALYFFAGGRAPDAAAATPADMRTGDTNGQLFADLWFVVRPDPFQQVTLNNETVFIGKGATLDFGAEDPAVPQINDPVNEFPTARSDTRDGFTLYTFDFDPGDDTTTCYTDHVNNFCSRFWPPLYADLGSIPPSDDYKVIKRPNGTLQWSYQGKPLYYFLGDNGPRQTNGTNEQIVTNNFWSLAFQAKPAFKPELSTIMTNVFQSTAVGNCFSCHAADGGPGGLELGGTREQIFAELQENSANAAYVDRRRAAPGSPDTSLLVHKIEGDVGYGNRMPLGGTPLSDNVTEAVRQWIANGARNE
jgi:predicted lipoprotein with Yx(FWY)xxD motif